jgi:hypothetical protein
MDDGEDLNMRKEAHILDAINNSGSRYKYRCKLCQQEWVATPKSVCPGVRIFPSRDPTICPQQYKTLAELDAKDLRPHKVDRPSAAFRPSRQGAWEFLYDETEAIAKRRSDITLKVLKRGGGLLAWLVNIVTVGIIYVLIGLNPSPHSLESIPIIYFVLQHPIPSLIVACSVVLLTLIGLLLFLSLTSNTNPQLLLRHPHPWSLVTATSTMCFLLSLTLLIIVLFRPPWCPTSLCPAPQRILITHPEGIHDENLDVYPIAVQSTSYVIFGDPAHYTLNNLPISTGALHPDGTNSTFQYHLIIGLNSLQQGRFGMIIKEVDLGVQKVDPIPHPLNVWNDSLLVHYDNENHYRVIYFGQEAGAVMPAEYLRFQNGFVHLKPRESDQIDIHIISRLEANLYFSVQVIYSIDNESQPHVLKLPRVFQVIFAKVSDWHLYHLQYGHFVANS